MKQLSSWAPALALLILISGAKPAWAQEQAVDPELLEVITELNPRSDVRVFASPRMVIDGQLQNVGRDTLLLAGDEGYSGIPYTSIDALWVRSANGSAARGFFIGASMGALAGALIGGVVTSGLGGESEFVAYVALVGAGSGLLAGGLIGATVSAVHRSWELRYPTEEQRAESGTRFSGSSGDSLKDRLQLAIAPDLGGGVRVTASLAF